VGDWVKLSKYITTYLEVMLTAFLGSLIIFAIPLTILYLWKYLEKPKPRPKLLMILKQWLILNIGFAFFVALILPLLALTGL